MGNIKKDIEELNIGLIEVANKEIDNIKLQKELNQSFEKKGLNQRMVKCIFSGTKLITDMNDMEKITFADTCHRYFKSDKYDISNYYSDSKLAEWINYINVKEKINVIHCEDFRRINSYEYHGDFTFKEVYEYMKNILWVYYPATQRSSKYREVNNTTMIREVNINKKSVNEICNLILEGKFEATEIILNCMLVKGKKPQISFEKKYKEIGDITIKPNYDIKNDNYTIVTILDGYHRILGICKAVEYHYEKTGEWINGRISCKLVLADIIRAKRIVELVFKRTDDDKNWVKSLEQSDYTEFVDMLIQNSSTLRNNVADIYEQCKYNNKLTYKVILTDTIKKLKIDVSDKSLSLFLANDMAKILDSLYDIIRKKRDDNFEFDRQYNIPNMFVGYITIAYMTKDKMLTLEDYFDIITCLREKIDYKAIKNLKLDVKSCSVNKVIGYFESVINEVIVC